MTVALAAALPASGAYPQCIPEEVAKIVPPDGSPADLFGSAIALDDDTLVVGSPRDDDNGLNSGSAYVFVRDPGEAETWRRVAKLVAADGAPKDEFGTSVSISGELVVVGAWGVDDNGPDSGAAYVFQRDHGGADAWGQVAKLLAPGGTENDFFGAAVSIDGDTLLVGAYFAEVGGVEAGLAYVFERNAGGADKWGLSARLAASDPDIGDRFGATVSICWNTIVIGAGTDDEIGAEAGAAYVFDRDESGVGIWTESAKLLASDGTPGDQFGTVAISGNTVLIGALTDDQNGQYAGSAYIFLRSQSRVGRWTQVAKLLPLDPAPHDHFGGFISLHDHTAVIGAVFDQINGAISGSAYVLYRDMGGSEHWGQVSKILPSDGAPGDSFGVTAIEGRRIAVGASKGVLPGAAYIFDSLLPYPPTVYCTAQPASIPNCVPSIQAAGVASATAASGLVIGTDPMPGESVGVFLYTHDGAARPLPLRFGTLCIRSGEIFVAGPFHAGGTQGDCNGTLAFDWNTYVQSGPLGDPASIQVGTTVDGQIWYRDPGSRGGANLTDAVSFTVCR